MSSPMVLQPSPRPAGGFAAEDVLRFRWDVWTKVFGVRIMPPKPVLDRLILERDALGTKLWQAVMRPVLESRVPSLFTPPADDSPAGRQAQRVAGDLRRVGASAYALTHALYRLHGDRQEIGQIAGIAAMWLAQAAAVIDYLLDEEALDPAIIHAHVSPDALAAALPYPGHDSTVPSFTAAPFPAELTFVLEAVEQGCASLRALLRQAPDDAHHRQLRDDLVATLRAMIEAEIDSTALRMETTPGDAAALDRVGLVLRRVNTNVVRLFSLAGLLAEPTLPPAAAGALDRMAELAGDIGWTLDALSDVHEDLAAGVWNRVWLALAGAGGDVVTHWLAFVHTTPERALHALAHSPIIDQLMAGIAAALHEIETNPTLPRSATQDLADVCRLLTWSFLVPPAARPPQHGMFAIQD